MLELDAMLSEGVPADYLLNKIVEWAYQGEDPEGRLRAVAETVHVIYENVMEEIPESIDDPDGIYRSMRAGEKIIRGTIERLEAEMRRRLGIIGEG